MHSICLRKALHSVKNPAATLLRGHTIWRFGSTQQFPLCPHLLTPHWGSRPSLSFCLNFSPGFQKFGTSSRFYIHLSWPQRLSNKPTMAEQRYCVEYAKRGTAGCKKCKDKIMKGLVRIGKIVPNPFSESAGEMKEWYHVKCIFEKLERARATTKKIEDITDLEGWEELQDEDKELINKHVSGRADAQLQYIFCLF